jgi:Flp pilus assembly protein TadD
VRAQVEAKKVRNDKLKKELDAASSALAAGSPTATPTLTPKGDGGASMVAGAGVVADGSGEEARRETQRAMSLFREKRYEEAAQSFQRVLALHPGHVMATNNLGFTYFKLGRNDDAITWYRKTIALDPKRAIAYANLGDALAQAGQNADARAAYQKFLELQPGSKLADGIQKKIALLP